MSLKFFRSFLIFIVIMLVCSITPIAAIQNGNNYTTDVYDQINDQAIEDMWNVFDEGTNTELTPEQEKYLDEHQDRLLYKAEAVLYNLQDFINFMIDKNNTRIVDEGDKTNEKTFSQRKLMGFLDTPYEKAGKHAEAVKDYLNSNNNLDSANAVNMTSMTYEDLNKRVINRTYNSSNVIMQIKEKGTTGIDYIRYMKIISINETSIILESGKKHIHKSAEQFQKDHAWKDNDVPTVYILVVPRDPVDLSCSNTDLMLYQIWYNQNTILTEQISMAPMRMTVCGTLFTAGLTSILIAGCLRLCDGCVSPTRQIVEEIVTEESHLIKHDRLRSRFRIINEEVIPNRCCTKCRVTASMVVAGSLLILGSLIALWYVYSDKIVDETELANLKTFTVPDPTQAK